MKFLKKIFCYISVFLFLNSASCFALSIYNTHFSISPLYQLQNGCLNEYVYDTDSSDELYKLSELNWKLKNLSYAGFQSSFGYKNLFFDLNFLYAIPKKSGNMEDSDWLNSSDLSMKTTYSISENTNNMSAIFKVNFYYNFEIINNLTVSPVISAQYNYYDFSARNAEGWYGNYSSPKVSWDDKDAVYFSSDELGGIDYTRSTILGSLGAKIDYKFLDYFCASFTLKTSPYTYVQSLDTHFADNKCTIIGSCYLDRMSGLFKHYEASVDLNYIFMTNFVFGIKGDYNYLIQMQGLSKLTGITGTSNSKTAETFTKATTVPRCSGYWWNLGIYAKIQF